MSGALEWGEGEERAIAGEDDLERALDDLEGRATAEPFLVELTVGEHGSLSLGLGRPLTVLDHVPADLDPPYRRSRGGGDGESLWFRVHGEASEFPPEAAVPIETGRRALVHFLRTGELSAEIDWIET